ncbi:MAG TPA: protealysin inhibitor emfourin [Anaerolineales bacterium]|nr:protealysin inhibitor emfourin [Anaerolineales bacterium]
MEVQRIKYERTGGFMGLNLHADFQPDDLPEEQARPLMDLLDEMDFDELPERLMGDSTQGDQFTYVITVETPKGERTIVVGDTSASAEMQELLRLLDRIARRKH